MAMDMIAGRGAPPDVGAPSMDGGPPPDAGGGGAPPPDLAALLGMGGGPGGPGGAPGGPPDPTAGQAPSDPAAIVQQMVDLSQAYLQAEQDQEDLLTMQKISTELQSLLAKDQQDSDKMMQGTATPRAMRKAYA